MSTNAVIQVEGIDFAEVYKHWDGYPEATLPFLEAFNKDFAKHRGDDPTYKFAQLLRDTVRRQDEFNLDPSCHTGWGVYAKDEGYWEFKYILKSDGSVEVISG